METRLTGAPLLKLRFSLFDSIEKIFLPANLEICKPFSFLSPLMTALITLHTAPDTP